MKGIQCCGDCAGYDRKNKKCGYAPIESILEEHFYKDCPLPDVAEGKHGEWIGTDGDSEDYESDYSAWIVFHCSSCNYEMSLETGEYGWGYDDEGKIPFDYCPHCGARMDGTHQ